MTTEQDLLKSLANRSEMLNVMSIMKILSTKGTNSLGDFEVQYVFDPAAIDIINKYVSTDFTLFIAFIIISSGTVVSKF